MQPKVSCYFTLTRSNIKHRNCVSLIFVLAEDKETLITCQLVVISNNFIFLSLMTEDFIQVTSHTDADTNY